MATKAPARQALVVMGMHRSGTSALARVLSLRGATLPEKLVPANYGNSTGYWEPSSVVELNDRMFDFFGVSWDDPFAAQQLPEPGVIPSRFHSQAREILEREYRDADLFVLKDPRCTLLHGFWQGVLRSMGVRDCPIVVARPFGEVADSLLRRDSTSVASSVLLYVAYGLEAATAVAKGASILTYKQLTDDWRASTDRIAKEQRFNWPRIDMQMQVEIEAFLSPSTAAERSIHISDDLRSWATTVWTWMEGRAMGRRPKLSALEPIQLELARSMRLFSPFLADRKRRTADLEVAIGKEQAQLVQATGMLDESQALLRKTADERQLALSERDKALQVYRETDEQLSLSRDRLKAMEAELDQAKRDLVQNEQARRDAESKLSSLYAQSEHAQGDLRRQRDDTHALYKESAAALAHAQSSYRNLEAESDTLRKSLAESERRIRQDGQEMLALQERLAARQDDLARQRDEALARLAEAAGQRDEALARLAEAAGQRDEALARIESINAKKDEALARLAGTESQRDETLAQLAGTKSQRDEALAQLAETTRQWSETLARLDAMAAQRREAISGLAETTAQRDELLARIEAAGAEREAMAGACAALQGEIGNAATEIGQLRAQVEARSVAYEELSQAASASLQQLTGVLADLENARNDRHALMDIYQRTDALLHQTEEKYRQLDREHARLQQDRDAAERGRDTLSGLLASMQSSRSWALTAPLRAAGRLGRRVLSRKHKPMLMLPPPATASGRDHAGLQRFLSAEFGERATRDVIARIDRYRLPVETDVVRSAASMACSAEEAIEWARDIAGRADGSEPPGWVPDVSIVVPVYNQLPFTLACLDALLGHDSRYSFEVLVGDDASTDATAQALAIPIARVRHVRNRRNLGFVRNCNATAARARGRFVVMLNNDTQVLPGWLDELIDTLEANPDIGLAGSKLVFPDGRLQECGAIVWKDGSAWNFGRLDDPRGPELSYMRDVDFVSGASIALRRDTWQALGGFDELFVPAYAEDADLAFRVRAHGMRTVVQPLSQLLHFEGVSSGTDLASGAKAYQVDNLKKLHERWRHVLDGHRPNACRPELEKERSVARRMLFVDLVTPTPNEDAGSLVACEMMEAFRKQGFKVTFIPADNFAHMGAPTKALQRIGIEAIYHPAYSRMQDFLSARDDDFEVILLVRFQVGEAHLDELRRRYPSAKILFSNCDLHYLREMREAELTGDPAAIDAALETKRRELGVISRCDLNLVHSLAEQELLQADAPDAPCVLFPLVHDPVDVCAPLSGRDGVCFVGGYRHPPNADGIVWFVENIWPMVLARDPSHRLYIAGSSMTDEVKALALHPNVEVVGFVEDLEGFLAQRRVAIAPLRFGAGAKGKVAVSLANGLPVVSTPVGAEGMQLEAGLNVLLADSEQDFAAALLEALGDDARWQALSREGIRYAAEVTSRASASRRVGEILGRLASGG